MRGGTAKTGGGSHVAGMRAMPRLTQYRFKYILCSVSWDQHTYLGGIGPKASYILTLFSANNEVPKELVPFTQLVKVRRGKLVLALLSIRFS